MDRDEPAPQEPPPENDREALDTAWRIHGALADWTGKVDAKASFCFAVESAVILAVLNLTAEGRLFDVLDTQSEKRTFYLGMALVAAGLICAADVVIPRLRRRTSRTDWRENFIYFGHLRHWEPSALEARIRGAAMLPVLAAQLVNMSRIAWKKHLMVQTSLVLTLLGVASLGWCAALVNQPA